MSDQSDQDPDASPPDDGAGVSVAGVTDGDVQASVQIDGQDVPVALDDDLAAAVQKSDELTLDDLTAAAVGDANFSLQGNHDGGQTVTVPVQDVRDWDLTRSGFDTTNRFALLGDDRIAKLEKNSVKYSEEVGDWILTKDDLVPAIKERIKALIIGEGGLDVSPADPNDDADRRLADHLEDVYQNHVRPGKVVDTVLDENLKNARAVLRSTDLQPLELQNLDYIRDGETGEEIYWQSDTTVWTFDVPEGGATDADDLDLEQQEIDGQALVIGEHVFDISLYDKPPLEAVADTVVNKKQMQRLKARKAEITSFGGIYVKVNPPDYLPEDEYFDRVETDDGDTVTKLERALEQNLDAAMDWAKGYQSGTTGSVPMHWEVEQIDIPEGDEPLDEQIRGYNRDISRRLLVPIDLIELREGSEMSRQTLMETLLTTIAGWRQEFVRVFDQFAQVQADIHGLDGGDVEHSFPPMNDANVDAIVKLLKHASVLGATSDELRQVVNRIEGVDLPTDDGTQDQGDQPPAGGPDDPGQRQQDMSQFLDEQNRRGSTPSDDDQDQDDAVDGDQDGAAQQATAAHAFTSPSLREAAHKVRRRVEDQLPSGHTVETVRHDQDAFRVIVHDQNGDIAGTMQVQESSVHPDQYVVTGTDDFFEHLADFRPHDPDQEQADASDGGDGIAAWFRSKLGLEG